VQRRIARLGASLEIARAAWSPSITGMKRSRIRMSGAKIFICVIASRPLTASVQNHPTWSSINSCSPELLMTRILVVDDSELVRNSDRRVSHRSRAAVDQANRSKAPVKYPYCQAIAPLSCVQSIQDTVYDARHMDVWCNTLHLLYEAEKRKTPLQH